MVKNYRISVLYIETKPFCFHNWGFILGIVRGLLSSLLRHDLFWVPSSLLYSRHRSSFPRVKAAEA